MPEKRKLARGFEPRTSCSTSPKRSWRGNKLFSSRKPRKKPERYGDWAYQTTKGYDNPETDHMVSCGPPPLIEKSDAQATVITGTKYLDTANYTCLPGYEFRDRRDTITCQSNRSWSNLLACDAVDCGLPPELENGHPLNHYGDTTFGSTVTYMCIGLEYRMLGSELVQCTEDGSWSALPLCYKVNCGPPPVVLNSKRHVSGHEHNDTVDYVCHDGYTIEGDNSVSCQITGHWTVPPECKAISCDWPEIPEKAELEFIAGTKFGQIASFECLPGYITYDSKYITCQLNGEWSPAPNCTTDGIAEKVNCGPPPVVLNSEKRASEHEHNNTIDYVCHDGYMMEGDNSVSCQNTGHWTVPPKCKAISCDWPTVPEKAELVFIAETRFGQIASFECLPGYTTNDSKYITCQSNQEWSPTPNCTLDQEIQAKLTKNSMLMTHDRQPVYGPVQEEDGRASTYTCGQSVTGLSGTLTSPNYPGYYRNNENCETVIVIPGAVGITLTVDYFSLESCCDYLRVYTQNGTLLRQFTTEETLVIRGDFVKVTFTTDGSAVKKGFSMRWQGNYNSCRQETGDCDENTICTDPCDSSNKCICNNGYEMDGRNCSRVSCGLPSLIDKSDAQATVITGTKYMDTTHYTCLPGYEFRSRRNTITCQSNRSWTSPPICDVVACGPPPLIEKSNAKATVITGTEYMDTANYTCLLGYEFRAGRDTITCQSNRSWTNPPTCDAVDCGRLPEVENGQPLNRYGNTTFESIITYMCIGLEYRMLGSELVRCTEDGSWSAPPLCYKVNCGPPPVVLNSERHVSGHEHNDTVDYVCHDGYLMEGENSISCQNTGHWTVPPECKAIFCDWPEIPQKAELDFIAGKKFGQTASFECLPGFTTDDPKYISCQSNGEWSPAPNCTSDQIAKTAAFCQPPPSPENTTLILITRRRVGETALYDCLPGYITHDPKYITCQLNGEWSPAPNCTFNPVVETATFCQPPSTPENTRLLSITGTRVGQTALYDCLPGYTTDDPKYIICQTNGEWSPALNCTLDQEVKEVNCGPPPVVLNSERHVSGHEHDDTVDYVCHDGYMMEGDNSISCQNTGYWTVPPECKAISCDWPDIPKKAQLDFIAGTKFGQIASFECLSGYTTDDSKYITCQLNGKWSPAPNCTSDQIPETAAFCQPPSTPINSKLISITGTRVGETALYECLPGYATDDPIYITCQLNGEWSPAPNCTLYPIVETSAYACGQSVTDLSGTLISPNYPYNYRNNENCETEIAIPGVISITLTVDDISLESCCDYLRVYAQNGTLLQQFTTQETKEVPGDFVKVTFTTDSSVTARGFSMRWQRVSCGSPPHIEKSDAQASVITGTKYMDTANYTCLPGYELRSRRNTITCQSNKSWTIRPICDAVDCGKPPEVENGQPLNRYSNTTFESTVTYMCIGLEYRMLGSELVRCTDDGSWSAPPVCYKVNCGPPPVVLNSERHVSGHEHNDTVDYVCHDGYMMEGENFISCQNTGHWTVPPECKAISCDWPEVPEKAELDFIAGTKFGQIASFECFPGFTTDDPKYITCQLNGEWSPAPNCTTDQIAENDPKYIVCQLNGDWSPALNCTLNEKAKEVNCGPPPVVLNSERHVPGHEHNDTVDYVCHDGYMMKGENSISCQNTGHWTVPPECKAISCDWPKIPANSELDFIAGTRFGQIASFECLPGYTTNDSKYITCQLNGDWSSAPNCTSDHIDETATSCQPPPTPENTRLLLITGTQVGETAVFECLPGYTTDDPKYIICQLNGEWSSAPNCTLYHEFKVPYHLSTPTSATYAFKEVKSKDQLSQPNNLAVLIFCVSVVLLVCIIIIVVLLHLIFRKRKRMDHNITTVHNALYDPVVQEDSTSLQQMCE
ncbi:sushi, von Willebrand factor type A, EGF and pentraxin domain-containing protein 1-like [Watersipora subatra]|uniref:sushi, von Willebrand factor type A, EGF and pentraxin domain-containing protein 1-like n=1 Tax=Watersipora subatra TaxID=2589382 RepID=UPI00355C1194